jgi:hypothetical protein
MMVDEEATATMKLPNIFDALAHEISVENHDIVGSLI